MSFYNATIVTVDFEYKRTSQNNHVVNKVCLIYQIYKKNCRIKASMPSKFQLKHTFVHH